MSFNSAMLEQMQAEGLDLNACIRVLRAAERKSDPTNAERQARHRAKKKAESNAVTVTQRYGSPNDIDTLTPSVPPLSSSNELDSPAPDEIEVKPEHVLEAWNAMASEAGLPKARMTPERRKKLNTFVKRHPIDDITEAIWSVPKSPFLCGENDRAWKADFDFLLEPKKFTKIVEGTYVR